MKCGIINVSILLFLQVATAFIQSPKKAMTPTMQTTRRLQVVSIISSRNYYPRNRLIRSASTACNGDDSTNRLRYQRKLSVGAILSSSFLNLLGFTMAGPITPALGKHFGLGVGASFGSLTSAYPAGMLLGLILWPRLSDNIGRKPIMTLSLLGSGIGLLLQGVVIKSNASLGYFLAARALTGALAGSGPVSKAYLADVGYKDGKLPRYLALRDASCTMAFIVGPVLGGLVYDIRGMAIKWWGGAGAALPSASNSLAFTIVVSAAASLLASGLVGTFVKEVANPNSKKAKKAAAEASNKVDESAEELISCPLGTSMWTGVASVCLVSFLFNIGDSTFHAFFSALLRDGAGLSTRGIGLLYTLLACISFVVSTVGSSFILKALGPVAACAIGMGLIGAALMSFGAAAWTGFAAIGPSLGVLTAAAAIYYAGVPVYGPSVPTMLLRCVPSNKRGAIMGLDSAINTVGRVISPLFMGEVYRRFGAGAAFGLAGSLVFSGMIVTLYRRFVVLKDT